MENRVQNKISFHLMVIALTFSVIACNSTEVPANPQADGGNSFAPKTPSIASQALSKPAGMFPFYVTDSRGKQISFEEPAKKIVVLDSGALDTLFSIGEWNRVVATHEFASYPPQASNLPKVSDSFNINIEAIVELDPDLVFVFYETFVGDLENAGLKVLYLKSLGNNFEKTTDLIMMWGRITGNTNAAEAESKRFENRIQAVRDTMSDMEGGLRVFQDVGDLWTPGPDTLMGEVFELLKLENIAHDISGYAQISPELIIERDPDLILSLNPKSITTNSTLVNVTAVKNDRVMKPPSDALSNAGPRFALGIEELAKLLYPEHFGPK